MYEVEENSDEGKFIEKFTAQDDDKDAQVVFTLTSAAFDAVPEAKK